MKIGEGYELDIKPEYKKFNPTIKYLFDNFKNIKYYDSLMEECDDNDNFFYENYKKIIQDSKPLNIDLSIAIYKPDNSKKNKSIFYLSKKSQFDAIKKLYKEGMLKGSFKIELIKYSIIKVPFNLKKKNTIWDIMRYYFATINKCPLSGKRKKINKEKLWIDKTLDETKNEEFLCPSCREKVLNFEGCIICHIRPKKRGGSEKFSNLYLGCKKCNDHVEILNADQWVKKEKKEIYKDFKKGILYRPDGTVLNPGKKRKKIESKDHNKGK